MENKTNLSHRIIVAFVLMTFFVSGLFATAIFVVVHTIEENLLSAELNRTMDRLQNNAMKIDTLTTNHITRFYADAEFPNAIPIPPHLKNLEEGFNEIVDGDEAYHVLVRIVGKNRFVLMQDQTAFEAREQVLYAVVIGGFIASLILSWILGHLIARRVIAPVVELSEKVTRHNILDTQHSPLAIDFSNDEVGQLAAAFDKSFGELSEAIKRERLFTADVSHELRTPLMIVSSSAELLLEDDTLPSNKQELLTRIMKAANDMRAVVDIFILLARGKTENSTGKIQDNAKIISLQELSNIQFKQAQATAINRDLSLALINECSSEKQFNTTLLTAVMSNLLRNALYYTQSGTITLRTTNNGFSVEDTGPGIPEEQRKDIFLPFRRGTHNNNEGIGLGLSLVQRICEHQNWKIELQENQPHGCKFIISL